MLLQSTISTTLATGGHSVQLLFAFEYIILASTIIATFLKYTFSMVDSYMEVGCCCAWMGVRLDGAGCCRVLTGGGAGQQARPPQGCSRRPALPAEAASPPARPPQQQPSRAGHPRSAAPAAAPAHRPRPPAPRAQGRWESKGTYVFYLELITDLLHLFVYCVFFVIVFTHYGLPLHLLRDLCAAPAPPACTPPACLPACLPCPPARRAIPAPRPSPLAPHPSLLNRHSATPAATPRSATSETASPTSCASGA